MRIRGGNSDLLKNFRNVFVEKVKIFIRRRIKKVNLNITIDEKIQIKIQNLIIRIQIETENQ